MRVLSSHALSTSCGAAESHREPRRRSGPMVHRAWRAISTHEVGRCSPRCPAQPCSRARCRAPLLGGATRRQVRRGDNVRRQRMADIPRRVHQLLQLGHAAAVRVRQRPPWAWLALVCARGCFLLAACSTRQWLRTISNCSTEVVVVNVRTHQRRGSGTVLVAQHGGSSVLTTPPPHTHTHTHTHTPCWRRKGGQSTTCRARPCWTTKASRRCQHCGGCKGFERAQEQATCGSAVNTGTGQNRVTMAKLSSESLRGTHLVKFVIIRAHNKILAPFLRGTSTRRAAAQREWR